MSQDLGFIIQWWFMFFLLGISSIPVSWFLFNKFTDYGYGFSKTIGFLVVSFFVFVLSISNILPYKTTTIFIVFLVYLLINAFLYWRKRKNISLLKPIRLKIILGQELLFTAGYVSWSIIRGYQPNIRGLEKFMDFGFINTIIRSEYLPPIDMWFSGESINYYWFGHFASATLTKLSGIPSAVTYNLLLATILGLTLVAAFSIISTMIKRIGNISKKNAFVAAGVISALIITFGGNFHTPIYAFKDGPDKYWYPEATRLIGYRPETKDKTIHEFPIYSFVVSDLHAHLINLPFVLIFIGLLLSFSLKPKSKYLIPLGFVLGVMFMTNTWDFANYLLAFGVTMTILSIRKKGVKLKSLIRPIILVLVVLIISIIIALPFILNFTSLAQGIKLVHSHTPLWQLGILWGFPAILTIAFFIFIYKVRGNLKTPDLFALALITTSWILIAIPEIIYLKDIYISSHYRANTMFKLTYQSFVMFYLLSGYLAIRILASLQKSTIKPLILIMFVVLFASVLTYPSFAINSYYGKLKKYSGLSGDSWLKTKYPGEYQAISWFNKNVTGQPTILEASGDSYSDFNVVSSYTGLPTISGWFVHEWLWRGSPKFPQERVEEINTIYTTANDQITKDLLNKYQVEYVIVGSFERQKYTDLNEEKFKNIGDLVFSSAKTNIYQYTR